METKKNRNRKFVYSNMSDSGSDYKQKCSVLEPLARRRSFIFVRQCYDSFLPIISVFTVGDRNNGKLDIVIIISHRKHK